MFCLVYFYTLSIYLEPLYISTVSWKKEDQSFHEKVINGHGLLYPERSNVVPRNIWSSSHWSACWVYIASIWILLAVSVPKNTKYRTQISNHLKYNLKHFHPFDSDSSDHCILRSVYQLAIPNSSSIPAAFRRQPRPDIFIPFHTWYSNGGLNWRSMGESIDDVQPLQFEISTEPHFISWRSNSGMIKAVEQLRVSLSPF